MLFRTVGDIKKTIIFTDVTEGTYDPATSTQTDTVSSTQSLQGIVSLYDRNKATVERTTLKARILYDDLMSLTTLPRLNDIVTIDTIQYHITDISIDAANACWILRLEVV